MITLPSSGSFDFNIKLISLTSYTQGGNVYPLVDASIHLTSSINKISVNVNFNQKPCPRDRCIPHF